MFKKVSYVSKYFINTALDQFKYQGAKRISTSVPTLNYKVTVYKPQYAEGTQSKKKKKSLSTAKRNAVWEHYAKIFIARHFHEPEFQRMNPPSRVFTVIKCWCCGIKWIAPQSFAQFSAFEGGHVVAQSISFDDSIQNVVPICKDCNIQQGVMHMKDFAKYMEYTNAEILTEDFESCKRQRIS